MHVFSHFTTYLFVLGFVLNTFLWLHWLIFIHMFMGMYKVKIKVIQKVIIIHRSLQLFWHRTIAFKLFAI